MATKKTSVKNISTALSTFSSVSGHGIRVIERMKDVSAVPPVERRIAVSVNSNIVDNYEGSTETRKVWSDSTNRDYVARTLSQSGSGDKDSVLQRVALFLINRSLATVLSDMIKVPMFSATDSMFAKSDLYRAFVANTNDIPVSQALMEITLPFFIELGFVARNGRFAAQDFYGFKRVEVSDLNAEIAVIQAFSALEQVKASKMDRTGRQSKNVFAESVAELFRPVGLAFARVPELSIVLEDIVRCVRAYITPVGSIGSEAVSVSSSWAVNPQIAELAQCLPFIRAALALPADKEVRLVNDAASLENWIRLVVQMLRDTPRYRWISGNEALRHYGVNKIRDLQGAPTSLVAYRSVEAEPVAQTVIHAPDAILGERAMFISAARDRVADVVKDAYGSARFSTADAAQLIYSSVSTLTELGFKGWDGGVLVDAWGNGLSFSDIAVLSADNVYVEFGEDRSILVVDSDSGQFDPVWWMKVTTEERQLRVLSGRHLQTEVLTCDPIEALLAGKDITAQAVMPARKQLLGPDAFDSTITNFDEKALLQPLKARLSYDVTIAGTSVRGALRAADFDSLKSVPLAALVRPLFNEQVIRTSQEAFVIVMQFVQSAVGAADDQWIGGKAPDEGTVRMVLERNIIKLLQLAQSLSPAFRREVREMILDRVLASNSATGESAQLLRAKLVQGVFAAHSDILALQFFLHIQGIPMEDAWSELLKSEEMARACAVFGEVDDSSRRS